MKILLAIIFGPAALYLVVANTHVTIQASGGGTGGPPAAATEVERVTAAAYRDHLDVALRRVLVEIGSNGAWTHTRAARIEREVPRLARRVGELSDAARGRVAAVDVHTATGRRFRALAAEELRRLDPLFRRLARDLRTNEPTRSAFSRWSKRANRMHRWYVTQLQSVVVGASPEDRAAVEAAARQF
jgi:hypothetical protein